MSSINLTQIEAQQRAELISNCHYDITLDVTSAPTEQPTFASTTDIRFTSGQGETFYVRLASAKSSWTEPPSMTPPLPTRRSMASL